MVMFKSSRPGATGRGIAIGHTMHKLKNFLIAGVAGLAFAGAVSSVFAADIIDIPEPVIPEVILPPSAVGGWYLRGDIGYAGAKFKRSKYTTIDNCVDDCGGSPNPTFGSNELFGKLKGSFLLGGGVGYQVTDYFRTDLTVDYMTRAKFNGYTVGANCGGGIDCRSDEHGRMSALSILANAYVDLGNFNGFTPYVGAGIGGTHVKWGDLYAANYNTTQQGAANWRFTWALMAGVSYDLTENLKLDAGYRFRRISGGEMFKGNDYLGSGYDKGMDIHDARIGLRYQFGGSARPASYRDVNAPVYQ